MNANLFCDGRKTCSVIAIEVAKLRALVAKDPVKLHTLWTKLAQKYIVLHKHYHFPFFDQLCEEDIQLMVDMSEIKIYQKDDGQKIDMKNGVIVLRG